MKLEFMMVFSLLFVGDKSSILIETFIASESKMIVSQTKYISNSQNFVGGFFFQAEVLPVNENYIRVLYNDNLISEKKDFQLSSFEP